VKVFALLTRDDGLWVGGLFSTAGDKAASSLARWVENPNVWLSAPEALAAHSNRVAVHGVLGLRFNLETSPNLRDWVPWTEGQGDADTWEFIDPAKPPAQFYRAVLTP
jgi:hypothetical protein